MSGGVDSSVTAALLLEAGCEVVGCFMRHGVEADPEDADAQAHVGEPSGDACLNGACGEGADEGGVMTRAKARASHKQGCCSVNDAQDARLVAAKLDIPLYVMNFDREFGRIIDYFVDEYNAGRTPNPCVRCNDWIKFGRLMQYADSIDADFVATGHYARIDRGTSSAGSPCFGELAEAGDDASVAGSVESPGPALRRGVDGSKDQSYVLFGTPRARLSRMLLPIGHFEKAAVREMAAARDLPVFNKPDSQEICFVPDHDYAGLVRRRSPESVKPGRIVDEEGRPLGEHPGHQHFTIGQRRGLSVSLGHPIYVVNKSPQTNTVTVGPRDALLAEGLIARETNWLVDPPNVGDPPLRCEVKIRYNMPPVAGQVQRTEADAIEIRFDQPQRAVTPGQAVACYQGDRCLGGGWIEAAR